MSISKFENDLSQGHVAKQLIMFALPCLLSNILQSLYSVADMIIVGQFNGTASMSAVNIGSQATFLITNMVFGLSVGATVLIGQYMGAGDRKSLKETIATLFTSLLFAALVLTVLMIILEVPLLKLIRTPAEAFSEASSYFFITMLGTVFIFSYNALSAVMRGMGDSKRPLIFITIACVTNVLLDLLLVAVFHMGAAGAAIATVVSQAVSVISCVIYLKKNDFIFDFKPRSFGFNRERLKMLLKIGIPASIQNTAVGISFLFFTALANMFGVTASAAVGAVGKLNGFAILPAIAMHTAVSAMSAQNLGAGQQKRAVQTMQVGMVIAACFSFTIFAVVRIIPEACLSMFGNDSDMIAKGVTYIRSFSFDYLIVPFLFCLNGLFVGAGHTTFSLINSALSSLLIRIPSAYLFGIVLGKGLAGIGMGAPAASFLALTLAVAYFLSGKWKKNIIIRRQVT
jgi:putative MATE family efflux protein